LTLVLSGSFDATAADGGVVPVEGAAEVEGTIVAPGPIVEGALEVRVSATVLAGLGAF